MKKQILYSALLVSLLFAAVNEYPVHASDAVVGNGSPASCTESAFDTAFAAANSGGGTITFNCGSSVKTITFTGTKNILASNVTIDGNNLITLSGVSVQLFFANGGVTFHLRNITLSNGNSGTDGGAVGSIGAQVVLESVQMLNDQAANHGGAVYCQVGTGGTLTVSNSLFENDSAPRGGAIYNDGCTATISNSTFQTNPATTLGGGIYNAAPGTLTLNYSLLDGNSATDGGGVYVETGSTATLNRDTLQANTGGYGGGLESSGTVTVNNSLITQNTVTGSGGGIWNLNGSATVYRTTISNNTASEGGGFNSYGTSVQITDANIVGNTATGTNGGVIYDGGGTVFVTNATISGNNASNASGDGGGIYESSDDNLTLTNVTLFNNQAGSLGGGLYHYSRYAVLTNVTIGNNTAGSGGNAIYENSPETLANPGVVSTLNTVIFGSSTNCDGAIFTSLGHNISKGDCPSLTDITDQNNYGGLLDLSALTYNGGFFVMNTLAPLAGSPLIDAGANPSCPATDQRKLPRPVDGDGNGSAVCDIGAIEFNRLPVFVDVPLNYWANLWIEGLSYEGITGGCITIPLQYCPEQTVTRAQMAIFLERGLHGSSYIPPNVALTFTDTSGNFARYWIEALKSDGITSGCGGTSYCPDASVTRAQMAVFLLKSEHGSVYNPPAVGGSTGFTDVPPSYWAAAWIKQLALEGITSGCGGSTYCPDNAVTRAQMAVFLVRTFNLP